MSSYHEISDVIEEKIILDPETWRLRLILVNKNYNFENFVCVQEFSSSNGSKRVKIGRHISRQEYSPIIPYKAYECFAMGCGFWSDGMCPIHPLIFVKETSPISKVYSATDTVPKIFYIAESTILGAGLGVFTRIPLPVGVVFGPYAGFLTYSKRGDRGGYSWEKFTFDWKTCYVDAKHKIFSNWMRYVNCARNDDELTVEPLYYYGKVYYVTVKPVTAGQELMTWYGAKYGEHLNIEQFTSW